MKSELSLDMPESSEMYLETILLLERNNPVVRQVDIARALGFKRPTVHVAVKKLAEQNLVHIDEGSKIALTPQGRQIAEAVFMRHKTFTRFLMHLGVDEQTAEMDACRIEHYVSEQTFQRIKDYCEKFLNGDC
ncbi:MAG TPA: metal-dependent transcriptional regulator [Anaerolineaceae bacterium]|mgnify:CR=1 FL=1|nr:metal-dependent transcriptional regulator [Anaerolineaceae bacterium]